MKAMPFISTMLNDQYRAFVLQEFDHKKIETYFSDWVFKDMVSWEKLSNYNSKATMEFQGKGNPYEIKFNLGADGRFTFPYPKNIEEFICDCERCSVDLYWNESFIAHLNKIWLMKQSEIEEYNNNLLIKIEKM